MVASMRSSARLSRYAVGSLIGVGLLVGLAACGSSSGPSAPDESGTSIAALMRADGRSFPIAFTMDNPCTPVLEEILLSGEDHLVIRSSIDGNRREHFGLHFNLHLTGSDGQGTSYSLTEAHQAVGTEDPDGTLIFHSRDDLRLVSHGPAPNFSLTATFRMDRNGEISFDPGEPACRG
jgi:hypothetical protein